MTPKQSEPTAEARRTRSYGEGIAAELPSLLHSSARLRVLRASAVGLLCGFLFLSTACRTVDATAFVGVHALAPDFRSFVPGQTVLVVGERIERVGPEGSFELPAGTRRIEARGEWLIPGLADAHGHPPDAEEDALGFEQYLLMQLAAGVTSVRSMRGTEGQLDWRERIAQGIVDGPALYVAGMLEDLDVAGGRERVRALAAAGYDHLKLLGGVERDAYFALADEARAVGLPFCGHVPEGITLADVQAAGQGVEHLGGFTAALAAGTPAAELAALAAEARIFQCPTQHFRQTYWRSEPADALRARPGVEWMPRTDRAHWERWLSEEAPPAAERERALAETPARLAFLRALYDAGAPLLVSGSHGWWIPPGFGVHAEMELFATAGIPAWAILRAASA
jgi:imidazolonepropionase-like amidohydrolase